MGAHATASLESAAASVKQGSRDAARPSERCRSSPSSDDHEIIGTATPACFSSIPPLAGGELPSGVPLFLQRKRTPGAGPDLPGPPAIGARAAPGPPPIVPAALARSQGEPLSPP